MFSLLRKKLIQFRLRILGYQYALPKTPRAYVITLHKVVCFDLSPRKTKPYYYKTIEEWPHER